MMHRTLFPATATLPLALACGALLALSGVRMARAADSPVLIRVLLEQPATQTLEVEIVFPASSDTERQATDLFLPTWRPGRYAEVYPANTLGPLHAADGEGAELAVHKLDGSSWRVLHEPGAELVVRYEVYANSLGNRTRHVDATHAFLSGSTVFLYTAQHRESAHQIELIAPPDWRVACGLERGGDARTLLAASYDELVDAPIEIGLHDRYDFVAAGRQHALVVWPPGARFDEQRVLADFTALIEEQSTIFDEAPYQRYVFLLHAGGGAGGGTEHRNSTIMQTSLAALESSAEVYTDEKGEVVRPKDYRRLLGLTSHEFFHTWNVKEVRPEGITPYDYQGPNYSTLFWLAEGGTSYYDDLTLLRAGLLTTKLYLEALSESIEGFRSRPGSRLQSLSQASFDSWIHGYGSAPNSANRTVSFYRKGSLATLMLDFAIRRATADEASFDDVFARLARHHGLDTGGYSRAELEAVVIEVVSEHLEPPHALAPERGGAGDRPAVRAEVKRWFEEWVDGTEALPLEAAFLRVGLELVQQREGRPESAPAAQRADLGLQLADRDGRTLVQTALRGGVGAAAGVQAGDELVAFDGRRLSSEDVFRRLRLYEAGESVTLHLLRQDRLLEVEVTLAAAVDGAWRLRMMEEASDAQKAAFEAWLHVPWDKPLDTEAE